MVVIARQAMRGMAWPFLPSATLLPQRSFFILHSSFFISLLAVLLVSCSTRKNTPATRRVQAFKARYNTYFNGHEAYLDGVQAQKDGNKDNYTEVIPLLPIGNKATLSLGTSNFDRAIEKCQKTIKQHSITKKPEWKSGKKKSAKDKIWLSQKEYNPFLHKAWMLMGQAQFQQGNFLEASTTFAYIQRHFFHLPNTVARARLMEALCYAEMEWFYDAEHLVAEAQRDSFPKSLNPLKGTVLADVALRREQWAEAIPHVQLAIKNAGSSRQRARLHFLLGQLYKITGENQKAYKEFRKVIRKNPPYELEFNARIQQTEVISGGQSKKMVSKLKRMAKNPKNENYLDQVYYAIGNIYLAQGDTAKAIGAYNEGVEKSTRNGVEKGVVWIHLGQLYWDTEQFVKAHPCYTGVLGLFDKDRDDYEEIDERAQILEELLPHASAIELQDSLQELARMDTLEMLKVVDNIIEELKKKEKEEKKAAAAAELAASQQSQNANQQTAANQQSSGGVWYFYNPTSVAAGKTEFQRKWGERTLEDNWRRSNKTVLATDQEEEEEMPLDSLAMDSLAMDSLGMDSLGLAALDTLSEDDRKALDELKAKENDPHEREYYIKNIPYTAEQLAASNALLVDGLYHAAVIYKDRMDNFPLAERTFQRILIDFPDFAHLDETYYNMFQLYARQGRGEEAATYRQLLIDGYPDNEHAKLVADPYFEWKGRYGKHVEDSLYQDAYDAFYAGDYATVLANEAYTAKEYPKGANRARFLFLATLSRLEMGERDQFLRSMREIVQQYPQSTVSELAGLYVKGLENGRILASGRMGMGGIWDRRAGYLMDADSLSADTAFIEDRNTDFLFVIAYEHDSINENQLLYEMARWNFTSFAVRNFDIAFDYGDGIDMMQIRSFLNYDEAYIYHHRLMNDPDMALKLEGLRLFIISEDNLKVLQRGKSFMDYFDFYDQHFDPAPRVVLSEANPLDAPPGGMPDAEDLLDDQYEDDEEEEEWEEEENYIF